MTINLQRSDASFLCVFQARHSAENFVKLGHMWYIKCHITGKTESARCDSNKTAETPSTNKRLKTGWLVLFLSHLGLKIVSSCCVI